VKLPAPATHRWQIGLHKPNNREATMSSNLPLIDPLAMVDTFCTELVRIETLGPCSRLIFAVRQTLDEDSRVHRVVCARIIVPSDQLASIASQAAACFAAKPEPLPAADDRRGAPLN
jgi:hypothetical protein